MGLGLGCVSAGSVQLQAANSVAMSPHQRLPGLAAWGHIWGCFTCEIPEDGTCRVPVWDEVLGSPTLTTGWHPLWRGCVLPRCRPLRRWLAPSRDAWSQAGLGLSIGQRWAPWELAEEAVLHLWSSCRGAQAVCAAAPGRAGSKPLAPTPPRLFPGSRRGWRKAKDEPKSAPAMKNISVVPPQPGSSWVSRWCCPPLR